MQDSLPVRPGSPSGGAITFGTFILASTSAVSLVMLSGCHSTPPASGFVSSSADRATERRLQPPDSMAPLQPFDEQFVVVAAPDAP